MTAKVQELPHLYALWVITIFLFEIVPALLIPFRIRTKIVINWNTPIHN